jgi:hypothetical protein
MARVWAQRDGTLWPCARAIWGKSASLAQVSMRPHGCFRSNDRCQNKIKAIILIQNCAIICPFNFAIEWGDIQYILT